MANTHFHHLPLTHFSPFHTSPSSLHKFPLPPKNTFKFPTLSSSSSSSSGMNDQGNERPGFKDFPHVSGPIRDLMIDLISTVEIRLESQLLPCTLPQDVQYFENQSDTAHTSLFLRSGVSSSPIDFIFGSWLHCELPTGASLNITSLSSYMNASTDTPQLLIELIQSSPTSIVILVDLPPRRDLVLHPDYLKTFYEDTNLDKQRQALFKIPEVQPYVSPSLYIRSVFSPTASVIRIDTTTTGGEERLEEILRGTVSEATKEVLRVWLDFCVLGDRKCIDEDDRVSLKKRDSLFKQKSIEIDIGASLPRMFGQETADRILGVLLGN
ncbi:hypothetical protein RND81_13G199000 [Saponaria officinalis]|uniref:Red chlorophyll catabolite reductase n=1 Tax=Saponaria officinalis TaxID=3572 RepID=A0AAW1GZV9_SAPOF